MARSKQSRTAGRGTRDLVGNADAWFLALQLCIIFEHSPGQHKDPTHGQRVYEALLAGGILEWCREAERRVLGGREDDWGPGLATGVSVVSLPLDWGDLTDATADPDRHRAVAYDFFFGDGWHVWWRRSEPCGVREAVRRSMTRYGLPIPDHLRN